MKFSKQIILPLSIATTLLLSGCGGGSSSVEENLTCVELEGASLSLNTSQDLSSSTLKTSKELLALSNSLIDAGSNANTEYIAAMLELSDDIGDMSDRILEMADKILIMGEQIGDMANRIVETHKIQSENVALTQANLLQAQTNLRTLLPKEE